MTTYYITDTTSDQFLGRYETKTIDEALILVARDEKCSGYRLIDLEITHEGTELLVIDVEE